MSDVLTPPIEPMLARSSPTLPPAGSVQDPIWQQKVDGYRTIAYIRSGTLHLQSRRGADLTPSFPDLVTAAAQVEEDLVLDGELVVFQNGRLDFSALQQRARLTRARAITAAQRAPAHLMAFDLLEHAGREMLTLPCRERLDALENLFARGVLSSPWELVASTSERTVAQGWMDPDWGRVGIEGVVLRSGKRPYRPGERELIKVRTYETAEAVIGGVTGPLHAPTTLLLGRYASDGRLRLIARTTPLTAADRREIAAQITPAGPEHPWRGSHFSSGWGTRGELAFEPVQPDTIAEFRTDTAVDDGRHRHPVRFLRLRMDLAPADLA
ncbi:ATP-dependent DNA ligase [Streptomyces sp. NPDC058657]|uniref:ATP-dependent DNA ligase n=1 Tax=unclassified Streptomyces TaxID=2593676 RepID=UPI0036677566